MGWGAADAALVLAAAAIVPKWSRWLNEHQTQRRRVEGEGGEEEEWVLYRPTSCLHLAQGFGTTFGYLALLDLLVARRAGYPTSRFFILHTLANIAITIAATPDAARSLMRPLHEPVGKMSILPVYLIAGLFTYHLSVFPNVPREEWVHHLLFGGGIGGMGLVNPASHSATRSPSSSVACRAGLTTACSQRSRRVSSRASVRSSSTPSSTSG